MRATLRAAGVALALGLFAGCDLYDRPNRPVPEGFQARLLDGSIVDRQTFKGKPWVVVIWVPG